MKFARQVKFCGFMDFDNFVMVKIIYKITTNTGGQNIKKLIIADSFQVLNLAALL
jgi:hypothetical protein